MRLFLIVWNLINILFLKIEINVSPVLVSKLITVSVWLSVDDICDCLLQEINKIGAINIIMNFIILNYVSFNAPKTTKPFSNTANNNKYRPILQNH